MRVIILTCTHITCDNTRIGMNCFFEELLATQLAGYHDEEEDPVPLDVSTCTIEGKEVRVCRLRCNCSPFVLLQHIPVQLS